MTVALLFLVVVGGPVLMAFLSRRRVVKRPRRNSTHRYMEIL